MAALKLKNGALGVVEAITPVYSSIPRGLEIHGEKELCKSKIMIS